MSSNFIFTHIFNTDLSANKSFYKELFNSIEYTGKNLNFAVNRFNSLGNEINMFSGNFNNLINRSSNNTFFNNSVLIGVNNEEVFNIDFKDNVYYILLSGKPKQWYRENSYTDITAHELLSQIILYTQAHKNNIMMGLDEVLKNTTGNFSIALYISPDNELYFFTSNKTLYVHSNDDSIWLTTNRPTATTELELSCSTNIDNRTVYYSKVDSRFIWKRIYIDDPISKDVKYDLTCNYDRSIESFILPFVLKDLYNPNKININVDLCINEDQYARVKEMFKNEVFDVTEYPIKKECLLDGTLKDYAINYADYINDQIEIDKYENIVTYLNGSRYIPVFKKLQSYEILQLGLYLNVPFSTFETNCNHPVRDQFGNYILCGECASCKELYTRFAQLGYTYDNMPIRFRNYTELDKIKIINIVHNSNLNEEQYLALRSKIIGVFDFDQH